MARYRVAVLFGSRSPEHDVSVVSAMQVIKYLSPRHDVVPIYITRSGSWLTSARFTSIEAFRAFDPKGSDFRSVVITPDTGLQAIRDPLGKGLLGKPERLAIDVVFPVFHGSHGEDGTVQGLLELADMPYVGSGVLASSVGMDKIATKAVLKEAGLPVLDYSWFTRADWETDAESVVALILGRFQFPLIVKPATLGSSIAVQKVGSKDELQFAVDVAIHYDTRILVEPCVQDIMEINCGVLGSGNLTASVCEQPVSRGALLSYEDKYLHGQRNRGMEGASRIIPAPIPPQLTSEIQEMAKKAFRAVAGAGLARVDFILDRTSDRVYVNELNTMPGSISFYLWEPSGIPPQELVDRLIELALESHRDKQRTTFSIDSPLLQQTDLLNLKK